MKVSEIISETVLGGRRIGGPTSYAEFKTHEDQLLRQLTNPEQAENWPAYRQALHDVRRVAKDRGIDKPPVKEDASGGGTSSGAVATSLGGGTGFGTSIFMRRNPTKKKKKQ